MNKKELIAQLQKICLALVPLLWGMALWLVVWGPISKIIPTRVGHPAIIALGFSFIYLYFGKALTYACKHYVPTFFGYTFRLPPWWLFVLVSLAGVFFHFCFAYSPDFPIINSLTMGILFSACFEELMARSIFAAYQLTVIEFIILNIISSFSFSFMHMGFDENHVALADYIFSRGHFLFSFMLAIIVYKTRRIELTILLHMLSNFIRYTLPVLILKQQIHPAFNLFLLILAGCSYYYVDKQQTIDITR